MIQSAKAPSAPLPHLNGDHDDALLDMARTVGDCPEATAARCVDADRTGLD